MGPPTIWQRLRQTMGRAFRETGQAVDRLAIRTTSFATTQHSFYDDPVIYQDHLSRHRHQFPLLHAGRPVVHSEVAYLAPCSTLIGSVYIGRGSSVWYGAVLRADSCENAESYNKSDAELLELAENSDTVFELKEDRFTQRPIYHGGGIYIGQDSNCQEGCIITARIDHCKIGNGVTVGHLAQIHSAVVQDFSLIGMGSILQPGAMVELEAFVAAGAVVGEGQVVRSGELWVGNPARKLRDLSDAERQKLHYQSSEYVGVALEQQGVMELGGNLSAEPEQPELLEAREIDGESHHHQSVQQKHADATESSAQDVEIDEQTQVSSEEERLKVSSR